MILDTAGHAATIASMSGNKIYYTMSTKKEKCCWKCWVSKRNHKTGAVEVFCENSSCDCHSQHREAVISIIKH